MARTVARVEAARGKAEGSPDHRVRDRASHVRKVQENPARAEARVKDKVRVNPNLHRVQVANPAQAETARPAAATHPAMFSSPSPAACRPLCIVQAAAVVKNPNLVAIRCCL